MDFLNNLYINRLCVFAFLMLPIALVTGPFLPEIIIFLISFFFIINCIKENKFSYFNNTLFKIFFFFYIILILSSLLGESPLYSLSTSIFYIRFIIFSLAVWWLLDNNSNLIKYFLFVLIILFFLLFLGSLYEILFKNYCGYFNEGGAFIYQNNIFFCQNKIIIGNLIRVDRLSSFFGKEMILGSFLSRFLPLVTALYILYYKKNNLPLFLVFFIIITSLIIFLSGERISFFFACLFLLIFFISIDLTKVVKFFSIFFIITSVLTTSYFYKTSSSRMYVQTFNQIFNPNGGIDFFSEDHKAHAITAYNIFKSNIFIGAGPKSFRKICHKPEYNYNEKSCTTHPHNTFLQLLAEVGLIGTLIPIFFLFVVIKKLFLDFCGIIKIKKYEIYFFSSFLISLFPFIPSGNFFNGWLNIVFYLPLGFYLNYKKRANT
jgi:hypothetical protein